MRTPFLVLLPLSLPVSQETCLEPATAAWIDVDHDGRLDLVRRLEDGALQVLLNRGDGGFDDATGALASLRGVVGTLWEDLDGDGRLDLLAIVHAGKSELCRGLPGPDFAAVGAGSGLDTFLAARAVGPTGTVIAVDMTEAMLERGRDNVALTGLRQVEYRRRFDEALPVADASTDLVISNGVYNLCPDKPQAFTEAFRVLKSGGRLQIADIVVHKDIPPSGREDIAIWTA